MSFEKTRAAVEAGSRDIDALDDLARAALAEGEERSALRWITPSAERSGSALLWQWVGLLHRALDEHELALDAFGKAAALAPGDAGIAHGHARVALEAGLDAVDLFARARALAPADGAVLLGLAAARNARGEGELAADELGQVLARSPAWQEGYEPLAQLLSLLGKREQAREPVEQALKRFPHQEQLWQALFAIDLQQEDYRRLGDDVERAGAAPTPPANLSFYRAIVAGELNDEPRPAPLFDAAPPHQGNALAIWRIRHLLRVGAVDAALPIIDQQLAAGTAAAWPYAATAWRLSGDARSEWLERDDLVRTFDLTGDLPPLRELADTLRRLHVARGEYLDQSVRGGTQTDGPLFSRIDPTIRKLRAAVVSAIENYVGALPPSDPAHPLLGPRRNREIRFSGSWSVRLRSAGRHANHVHPQGWISSALYVALPDRQADEPANAGWFTIGQPPAELALDLAPRAEIEPARGRLVLFPSWMWHGTVPFAQGERLTVAFDVRPPI